MFDFESFCDDYGIDIAPDSHKHSRPGWINVECPRCTGNPGYHLGFSENSGQCVCWRCGFVPLIQAVQKLSGAVSWQEAREIAKRYGAAEKTDKRYKREPKERNVITKFPKGTLDYFPKRHENYLESRYFDPEYLVETWDLRATGSLGDYKHRIIAPIYYRDILMSYQGRDITGKSTAKYKACSTDEERRHHKYCLYGLDMAMSRAAVVVEGITDVWRLGPGAVATFGIKYKEAQTLLLYKHFDRIFVLFDETDPESHKQGMKLAMQLSLMGKEAIKIDLGLDCDPGDLSEDDANYLMRELFIK